MTAKEALKKVLKHIESLNDRSFDFIMDGKRMKNYSRLVTDEFGDASISPDALIVGEAKEEDVFPTEAVKVLENAISDYVHYYNVDPRD